MSTTAPPEESLFEFYRFEPSLAAMVVSIALFALISIVHAYQLSKSRNWISLCLVLGGILQVQSYVTRIFSAREGPDYTLGLFVGQAFGALIAPALFAALIYVSLGRIVVAVGGEKFVWIRVRWLTRFFVAGDVLGLLIQCAGAVLMPRGSYDDYLTGANIVIGGLALLTFYITLFMFTAVLFHFRIHRSPTTLSAQPYPSPPLLTRVLQPQKAHPSPWQRNLVILYITSSLIFIRSIYRLVEYSGGNNSWLMRNEWTLYIFDTLLMFVLLILFALFPPVPRPKSGSPSSSSSSSSSPERKSWASRILGGNRGGSAKGESIDSESHELRVK